MGLCGNSKSCHSLHKSNYHMSVEVDFLDKVFRAHAPHESHKTIPRQELLSTIPTRKLLS